MAENVTKLPSLSTVTTPDGNVVLTSGKQITPANLVKSQDNFGFRTIAHTPEAAAGWWRVATLPRSATGFGFILTISGEWQNKWLYPAIISFCFRGTTNDPSSKGTATMLGGETATNFVSKVRLVCSTTGSGDSYLEVFADLRFAASLFIEGALCDRLKSLETGYTAGSIPTGYVAKEIPLTAIGGGKRLTFNLLRFQAIAA